MAEKYYSLRRERKLREAKLKYPVDVECLVGNSLSNTDCIDDRSVRRQDSGNFLWKLTWRELHKLSYCSSRLLVLALR
jgi:hypothetical protein